MPVAHSSSFVRFLRCILLGVTLVVLPGRAIGTDRESLAAVGDVLDHGNVDAAHFVPAVLQLLVKDKAHLNRLSRLGLIGWGGGNTTAFYTVPLALSEPTANFEPYYSAITQCGWQCPSQGLPKHSVPQQSR